MSRDNIKDKIYPGSEDEFEEISSVESTVRANELSPHQRSVHFILDERILVEERQIFTPVESFSAQNVIPIIRVGSARSEEEKEESNEKTSLVENSELVDINHNDKNFFNSNNNDHFDKNDVNGRRDNSGKMKKTLPSFEELSGGLSPITAKDKKNTLFFNDGVRRIDLVLVYEDEKVDKGVLNEQEHGREENRKKFQESLIQEGLELEIEDKENSYNQKTVFIKVHIPYDVMIRYSTVLHMKKPVRALISISSDLWDDDKDVPETSFKTGERFCAPLSNWFLLDGSLISEDPAETTILTQENEDKLLVKDREKYFTSAQRTQVVWHILLRARYGEDTNLGIRKLLQNRSYISAYPLHEGKYDKDAEIDYRYDRRILYLDWAQPRNWFRHQPLWLIRKYFGDKIALYFAWLGFYTNMLILPSIVGVICFIYGLVTMDSEDNIPSKEICDPNIGGNITLCPLCYRTCKYRTLGDSCLFSNITYLFDNTSTVFFSVFMSFWATSFLEMWKRKQAIISWQWDLSIGIDEEETRPEYDTAASVSFKINPVTRRKEPYVKTWKKSVKVAISVIVVTFMIFVVICAVIITIIARMVAFTWIGDRDVILLKGHLKLLTAILAAIINLLMIVTLTRIYHHVAIWLTNEENPKTPNEYEKSFIVKIFLFEFMNYYSSLIYIAFFKGRFFTHPGDRDGRNSLLMKLKGDVCDPAGCLSELCIQLAIIMVGKQWFSNALELAFPALRNWWRKRTHRSAKIDPDKEYTHWEENYNLQDPGKLALFDEYLEMVIQYGFVTLFVAAFPLAPLFALLNNICEIRLDAYKMVAQSRRPLAERVEDIGAWYTILRVITYCAVVFNAFVIAYTSDYIPRKIYQYYYSENNNLVGYIDSSLSAFNTSHFRASNDEKLAKSLDNAPKVCQYRGYRYGPEHEDAYELSPQYWVIFGARLVFVVIFEHFVFSVTGLIASIIPDVPYQVARQIQLEKLLIEHHYSKNRQPSTKPNMDDYDKFLIELREAHSSVNSAQVGEVVRKGSWGRKLSRRISTISYSVHKNKL